MLTFRPACDGGTAFEVTKFGLVTLSKSQFQDETPQRCSILQICWDTTK